LENLRPNGINVDRNTGQMTIPWNDGHSSVYSFSLLRHACPCAECRGGHANMRSEPDPAVFDMPDEATPATMIRHIELVGSYALTIEWEDGHHYGIYTWHYLRALCPCPICRKRA
jgi:DUF971 family protein